MRGLLTFGLFAGAAFILWRIFGQKNDLDTHMDEQQQLQNIAKGVSGLQNAIWNEYPLTTVGDTPLAGVQFDPLNPDSIAGMPKDLMLFPGLLSTNQ